MYGGGNVFGWTLRGKCSEKAIFCGGGENAEHPIADMPMKNVGKSG